MSTAECICVTLNSCMMLPKLSGRLTRSEKFSSVQCVQEVRYRSLRSYLKSRDISHHMVSVTCPMSIISHNIHINNNTFLAGDWQNCANNYNQAYLTEGRITKSISHLKTSQRKPRDCKIYRLPQSVVLTNQLTD